MLVSFVGRLIYLQQCVNSKNTTKLLKVKKISRWKLSQKHNCFYVQLLFLTKYLRVGFVATYIWASPLEVLYKLGWTATVTSKSPKPPFIEPGHKQQTSSKRPFTNFTTRVQSKQTDSQKNKQNSIEKNRA